MSGNENAEEGAHDIVIDLTPPNQTTSDGTPIQEVSITIPKDKPQAKGA